MILGRSCYSWLEKVEITCKWCSVATSSSPLENIVLLTFNTRNGVDIPVDGGNRLVQGTLSKL